MLEHDENRTMPFVRELAAWGCRHEDPGVGLLANDVLVLDELCQRLYAALSDPEQVPSARFMYETLYDTMAG